MTQATKYGDTVLDGLINEMQAASKGQRNETLNKVSFRFGQLVSGGELPEGYAVHLINAAKQAGLSEREIKPTWRSGFEHGKRNPSSAPQKNGACFDDTYTAKVRSVPSSMPMQTEIEHELSTYYFDVKIVEASKSRKIGNSFIAGLRTYFDEAEIKRILQRYDIGTGANGECVFWYAEDVGRFRYGKKIAYMPNLKRDRNKSVYAIHTNMRDYDKTKHKARACFFGQHLLLQPENKDKPVVIVESEKTACVCSEDLPQFIILATGGKSGVKWREKDVWNCLKGRTVWLFPDADAVDSWRELIPIFKGFGVVNIHILNEIKDYATKDIKDIADHFLIARLHKKQQPIIAQNSAQKTAFIDNAIVANMTAKNTSLLRFMQVFDCEVTNAERLETNPQRLLTSQELRELAMKLPDCNSWTESELCTMFNAEPKAIKDLVSQKQLYYIELTDKYCKIGCSPF